MGKYVLRADNGREVVLHDDTLHRFIEEAVAAHNDDPEATRILPGTAYYVAEMLRPITHEPQD